MVGGFSFKKIHSSTYGVFETPESRILFPQKRRTLIEIPGRSEAFVQEDGGYSSRVEAIQCSYIPKEGEDLQRQVRKIAGWLSGVGELTFDYEPEMHYNAFLSSAPPLVKDISMQYASFTLEFTINHPFAYEDEEREVFEIESNEQFILETKGTIATPIRLIIKNSSDKTITNLQVTHKFITY